MRPTKELKQFNLTKGNFSRPTSNYKNSNTESIKRIPSEKKLSFDEKGIYSNIVDINKLGRIQR